MRRLLNAGQAIFAQFLGVSVKKLRAWEGGKPVNPMACRILDEIRAAPEHWKNRFTELSRVRGE